MTAPRTATRRASCGACSRTVRTSAAGPLLESDGRGGQDLLAALGLDGARDRGRRRGAADLLVVRAADLVVRQQIAVLLLGVLGVLDLEDVLAGLGLMERALAAAEHPLQRDL